MVIKNPFRTSVRYRDGIPIIPGDFPGVGHLPTFFTHALEMVQEGEKQLGPLFWGNRVSFNGVWTLLWSEREAFDLLKNKTTRNLSAADAKDPINFVGESLTTLDGPPHVHIRSAMRGPFSPRGLDMSRVGAVVAEMIDARVDEWIHRREIENLFEAQDITLNIIFRIIGIRHADLSEWGHNYREMLLGAYPPRVDLPGFPLHRSKKALAWVNQSLLALVAEARKNPNDSLLSAMVHGKDEDGNGLSDKELLENLRLLILAGHETTASMMGWILIALAQRPDIWKALVEESTADKEIPATLAGLKKYEVAEGLFRELVRLYPTHSIITRKTTEALHIRGYEIPSGTLMGICVMHLLRDPELYPEPARLDPWRWKDRTPTPLEMSSFGGGPHFCLGYHLTWLEMVQFVLILVRRMTRARLRPALKEGASPQPIYFPVTHPPRRTRIVLRDTAS